MPTLTQAWPAAAFFTDTLIIAEALVAFAAVAFAGGVRYMECRTQRGREQESHTGCKGSIDFVHGAGKAITATQAAPAAGREAHGAAAFRADKAALNSALNLTRVGGGRQFESAPPVDGGRLCDYVLRTTYLHR